MVSMMPMVPVARAAVEVTFGPNRPGRLASVGRSGGGHVVAARPPAA